VTTSQTSYGWQIGANRVMLLSDDRSSASKRSPVLRHQLDVLSRKPRPCTGRTGSDKKSNFLR
jgi:hypothetical protein